MSKGQIWAGMNAVSGSFFDGDKISVPPGVLEHLGVQYRTVTPIGVYVRKHRDGRVTLTLEGPTYNSRQKVGQGV